jgi:hypothetical protein
MKESIDTSTGSVKGSSKPLNLPPLEEDAVFGEMTEEGPNYRDVNIFSTVLTLKLIMNR